MPTMKPITDTRDDLIERFAIEIGAERPEAVQPKRIRIVREKQSSGHPAGREMGKTQAGPR
jgi:hypothetical protein